MRRSRLIPFLVLFLWLSASRSPAPIVETPDQPPATTDQSAKQKVRRRSTTTQSAPSQTKKTTTTPVLQGPARFAGSWTGQIKQGLMGRVTATFTVSADATSVQASQNMGGGSHTATMNGDTLSWSTGTLGATANLTPSADSLSAQLTLKGLLGSTTATLRRSGAAPITTTTAPPPQNPAPLTVTGNTSGYDTVALRPAGSMTGPKPQIPEEARTEHLSGQGVFLLHFDKPTGNLLDVTVSQSTGSTILDQAALATLRQWHATPGCPREVPLTVTFSVTTQ
jgi:TonB family protein